MDASLMNRMAERLPSALKRARQRGADGARIACSHSENATVGFEAGRLKDTGGGESFGYTVDVIVKRRRGQASGNDPAALDRTIERAITLASIGSVSHFASWPPPAPITPVPSYAARTLGLTREQMIDACARISDALKTYCSSLYIACQCSRSEGDSLLFTSGGVTLRTADTGWSLGAEVQRTEGTDMLSTADGRGWGDLNAFFDPSAIAGRILRRLRDAEKTVAAPTGRIKAVLPPEVLRAFLAPFLLGINGRAVAKGESPLAGKLGQRVLARCFTIADDPHRDYCPAAAETDGDGIPTECLTLVEDGVLQRFLYDLDSAALAGAKPTGHRGCSPYYPVLARGQRSSGALLADVDDGLLLTSNLIGFGQSNMLNGDFSCNVGLGYRIRDGKIAGRVKDTMIAGNLYDILGGNVELSADTNYQGNLPHALVEGLSASARAG